MGQSETQLRKIREAYAFLDELNKLAAVADEGFIAKAGDYNFKLPPDQVNLIRSKFTAALNSLKAVAVSIPLICFLLVSIPAEARITGTVSADADAWCVGPENKEVCADKDGHFVPTKNNVQDLGSTALKYRAIYATNMATTDTAQTITGAKTFTAAQSLPTVASSMTIQGAGGLGVTYGITAATITTTGAADLAVVKTSSLTVNGYDILGAWHTWTPAFTGSGSMTVSAGTIYNANYMIHGRTMCVSMYVYSMTVGGTPSTDILMALPASKVSDGPSLDAARLMDNSVWQTGTAATVNASGILWNKTDASNWTAGAGTRVTFNMCFPIQ